MAAWFALRTASRRLHRWTTERSKRCRASWRWCVMAALSASSPSERRLRSPPSALCGARHRGKTPLRCRRTFTHGSKSTLSNTASSARKQTPRRNPGRRKRSRRPIPSPISRMPRSVRPARSLSSRTTNSWYGATAREYSICAAIWPRRWVYVKTRSSCAIRKGLAATDITVPTTLRSMRRCLPGPHAGAADRNAIPLYDIPSQRIVNHYVREMPVRTSALRSLGAYANVFAIESFMDELAEAAGFDPVEYRLRHLRDPRARAVIESVARRAGWRDWPPGESRGHGIAFAKYKNLGAYCAVVAEVEVDHEVRVKRLLLAVDVGLIINPDGVINQIEGGAIQSTSWTLKEQVKLGERGITSLGWEEYPVLKFSEVPAVEVELINRPELPSVGAGEAAQGPTGAAIANAVAHALGLRVRELPLTHERIAAAISQSN